MACNALLVIELDDLAAQLQDWVMGRRPPHLDRPHGRSRSPRPGPAAADVEEATADVLKHLLMARMAVQALADRLRERLLDDQRREHGCRSRDTRCRPARPKVAALAREAPDV